MKDLNRFAQFDFRFARRPLVLAKRLKKSSLAKGNFLWYLLLIKTKGIFIRTGRKNSWLLAFKIIRVQFVEIRVEKIIAEWLHYGVYY